MSQFEEIPSPGYGFQGSRVRKSRALAACTGKTLGMPSKQAACLRATAQSKHWPLTARATAGLGWKLLARADRWCENARATPSIAPSIEGP